MRKKQVVPRFRSSGISTLCLLSSFVLAQGTGASPQDTSFSSSNLPIIVIDTHGQTIADEPKISADMGIIYNGEGVRNSISDPFNNYQGKIGIEIRGSSSQMFPKKQYAVETRDTAGNDASVSLLGLPEESDWVLSAPYNDKSLMRDVLIYTLARRTGRYASRAKYFELILNREYMGVYILLEKIKRNKNRVNISKLGPADTTGDALTGGYITKVDKVEGQDTQGWYSKFPPYPYAWQKTLYQYHYPKQEDIVSPQKTYVQSFLDRFEATMNGPTYADSSLGYPRLTDSGSFVDVLLLNELSKNVDGYRLSAFMYKDRDSKSGKLTMGPIWDYNHAFGNSDYYDASLIPGFQLTYLTTNSSFLKSDQFAVPFWWKKLFDEAAFANQCRRRWNELRMDQWSLSRITSVIDSVAALLDEARVRNFARWPVLGTYVWPNYFVGQTYQQEIDYLRQWVRDRVSWLDGQWETTSVEAEQGDQGRTGEFSLSQNYPNPFNGGTTIRYMLPREAAVNVSIFDPLGRLMVSLLQSHQEAGHHQIFFDGSGLASGIYFYRIQAGGLVQTKALLLLK
jgi:hypothetical protein